MTFTDFLNSIVKNEDAALNSSLFGQHYTYEVTPEGAHYIFESIYCMGNCCTRITIDGKLIELRYYAGAEYYIIYVDGVEKTQFETTLPTEELVSVLLTIGGEQ